MAGGHGCGRLKSFKDPVHGYVDLCASVAGVVDTWVLQRLRGIRQTALAHLVYHGMEHSRFNHSLGAAHLAREVLGFLAGNTELYYRGAGGAELADALRRAVEVFQLAALVHDAGHLPFSHASELGILEARVIYQVREFEALPLRHEEYTYALLPFVAEEAGVEPVFTGGVLGDLEFLLRGGLSAGRGADMLSMCAAEVLHKLVSSGLDVDRMDYLIRDSYYAGVRYGVFDVDRLVRVLVAVPLLAEPEEDRRIRLSRHACSLAVLDKGLSVVEAFMLARFYMFSEVYLHRVVEAYNSLYARLLALLARDGVACPDGGCPLPVPSPERLRRGEGDAVTTWRMLDDHQVIGVVRRVALGAERASAEARRMAEMLLERRHPKGYAVVESERLWHLLSGYASGAALPRGLRSRVEELYELQRENPFIHVRPLHVDPVSVSTGLLVYDRERGMVEEVEGSRLPAAERLRRLRRREEVSLYRVAVFAPTREEAERVKKKLVEIEEALASGG